MTIEARFNNFHAANPHVYELFKRFAFEAIKLGARRISAKFILERVRWESMIKTRGAHGFKLNNDFTSRYARLFIAEYPTHSDIFETRSLFTR